MDKHRNPQDRLQKHPTDHNTESPTMVRDCAPCTAADLDAVRYELARVDVMAQVASEHFDRTIWREVDGERTAFVAHLVAATAEAASAALLALDDLRFAVGRRAAVPSGDTWQDG